MEIFNEKSNISSREIALLTGKSHEQVLKDCDNLNIVDAEKHIIHNIESILFC